ncbi:MAG: VWA domain-containing protein [Synergistaceae bacterium]|nr:VWA domain-containing protein [Synergistaceae bacterium]
MPDVNNLNTDRFYQEKRKSTVQGASSKISLGASQLRKDPSYTFFLIDRSGSMGRYTQKVIDAYEASIDNLRKSASAKTGAHFITTALFNDSYEIIQEIVKLHPVKGKDGIIPLVEGQPPAGNFYPTGTTALYDCLYEALDTMLQILNLTANQGVVPRLNIALISDGEDNMSTRDTSALRGIITQLRQEEFLKVSVVIGLLDDRFTADMLEEIRQTTGFEKSVSISSSAQDFRRAFLEASSLIR